MKPDRQSALGYLAAPADGFWHWSDQATVIAWYDGTTLAFRAEIVRILHTLAVRRLPPFGALVVLLAAGRGKVPSLEDLGADSARPQLRAQIRSDLQELGKVALLPPELRANLAARCLLAEAVFEFARTGRHTDAAPVLAALNDPVHPIAEIDLVDTAIADRAGARLRHIHLVASGLRPHTAESLALRLRTGLDEPPLPATLGRTATERARALIETLLEDPEHADLARTARDLRAAVRLPRLHGQPEPGPSSGVADLTHHGPLDRLLVSELAHDDLTLSVRVALDEALYLRREPERGHPPQTLVLLLDSGIRSWGIPRLLATAAALALVANTTKDSVIHAWTARAQGIEAADLLSRAGLLRHLSVLEPHTHPGQALAVFLRQINAFPNPRWILLTHADTLLDPDFRPELTAASLPPGFVATIDALGGFELHAVPLKRRPPVGTARIDLRTRFTPPTRVPFDPSDARAAHVPVALLVSPFPFLLPTRAAVRLWAPCANGDPLAVLDDGTLVRYANPGRGARYLAHDLPAQPPLWLAECGTSIVVVFDAVVRNSAKLVILPASGGDPHVLALTGADYIQAVHRCQNVLLIIREHHIRAYSLEGGGPIDLAVNPYTWVHGRYLADGSRFLFVSWNGSKILLEPLAIPAPHRGARIRKVFDRPGDESPWVIHDDGRVMPLDRPDEGLLRLDPAPSSHEFADFQVSPDGRHIAVRPASNESFQVLDLTTGERSSRSPVDPRCALFDPPVPLPVRSHVDRLTSLGRLPDGLAFLHEGQVWNRIARHGDSGLRWGPCRTKDAPVPDSVRAFIEVQPHPELGCELRVATWPRGSRAFLDSRGLLHLKSHLPTVPEVSLVLAADRSVAGWTSCGDVAGPDFYFESPTARNSRAVEDACREFLLHL